MHPTIVNREDGGMHSATSTLMGITPGLRQHSKLQNSPAKIGKDKNFFNFNNKKDSRVSDGRGKSNIDIKAVYKEKVPLGLNKFNKGATSTDFKNVNSITIDQNHSEMNRSQIIQGIGDNPPYGFTLNGNPGSQAIETEHASEEEASVIHEPEYDYDAQGNRVMNPEDINPILVEARKKTKQVKIMSPIRRTTVRVK